MARAKKDDETRLPEDAPETPPAATEPGDASEEQDPPEPPVLLFVGTFLPDGRPVQFLHGIPARNLTQSDLDALGDTQRKAALKSGLYRDAKEAS